MTFQIEALQAKHDRKQFDCGTEVLNKWLQQTAMQQQGRNLARTYVATDPEVPGSILGYVSLTVGAVESTNMPIKGSYPKTVPIVLVGRLAVSQAHQGQGIGEALLMESLDKAFEISQHAGLLAVVVDAKDERAATYYQRFGFASHPEIPLKLFLPIATLAASR